MAFNLDLTLLLAIAVSACSGTESNHPSAGGTSALDGSSSRSEKHLDPNLSGLRVNHPRFFYLRARIARG